MAPKKNENKTALVLKIPKDKVTKTRLKKESPQKKKEVTKVKIALKNLKNAPKKRNASIEPPLTIADAKKVLTFDRMNEVALAQLVKDCPVPTETAPEAVPKKITGRKKKTQAPVAHAQLVKDCPVPTATAAEPVPKKITGRKKKIQEPESEVVPKKKLRKTAKVPPKEVKKPIAATKKTTASQKKRGRRPVRGKLKADDDTTITSPSILSQGLPECKTPVKETQKPIPKSPADPGQNTDSRRTSIASASEWSWTKDISGSSTTTCITVCSTDFVRIDGKLPEVKLNKIDLVLKKEVQEEAMAEKKEREHSLSEDSSSSDSMSSTSSSSNNTTINNALNLSTSSISPGLQSSTYTAVDQTSDKNKSDLDEVSSTIEMLAPKLKSFDLSFPDIGNENECILDMKPFEEKIFRVLEEEYNAVLECNFLNQLLSEKRFVPKTSAREPGKKPTDEPDFAKPDATVIANKSGNDLNDSEDNGRRRDTYDAYDDDDALSLFAESLTGIDSTRLSTSSIACGPAISDKIEEYVPLPVGKRPVLAAYQPTRIDMDTWNAKTKPVCEKQNADSTSVYKEPILDGGLNKTVVPVNNIISDNKQPNAGKMVAESDKPQLTIYFYKSAFRSKSLTVHDVCFFNLTSNCKKEVCFYPHRIIEEAEFKSRLVQLSEEQFFQEYMRITKWPVLRRKYVKCFADECQRRELPKILVEIVIDFLSKAHPNSSEDCSLRIELIESTLMYLNFWDLEVCGQLLKYNIGGKILCDVFLDIIGNSQNFSRFKNVFLNLSSFMLRVNRTFNLEVVAHVLERVCILPFEAPLSAVLVSILEKTDKKIFDNNMMDIFEKQLNNFNKELYNRLINIKEKCVRSENLTPVSEVCPPLLSLSPCGSKELEPLMINLKASQDYEQRYTSPDTTNTDNLNKPVTDPVIIRTFNHLSNPTMSKPKPYPDQDVFPHNWNQRSILQRIPRIPQIRPQKRPMSHPLERPQFKFQRRFGPDFQGNY